ncbi:MULTISPECIES: polysaccharide biosynthesis C-terminal domain-containing protein [unclassified Sinorhizobium]|uniref:oligosaccharide flippase family protein n=1 Tax=unclassified Sinorhizobium TaxID=2613772 RepID=UPI0035233E82
MAKSIMANSALNAAAGMTMLLTGFVSAIAAARLLGPEANGVIAFSYWLTTSGTLIAGLGADVILPRVLPQLKTQGMADARRRGFAAYFARAVIAAVVILLCLYILSFWESERLHWAPSAPGVALVTGILFFVQAIGMLSINFLIAEQRLETFFRLTLLSCILQLVTVFAGASLYSIEGALIGYILGQAAFFLYTLNLLRTRADSCGLRPAYLARMSVIISLQIFIEAIFLNRIELLFLQRFLNVESVGFYAIGLSLANLALQLPVQATGSLVPYYTEQLQARGSRRLPVHFFAGVMRSLAYITMPMSFGLAAISPELVVAIFGEPFRPAAGIVALLALSAPLAVFTSVSTKYMFATDLEKQRTTIGALGAIVMVVGCIVLVPALGGEGAAITRIVVGLFMSVLMVRRMDFEGSLAPMYWSILRISAAALACAATAYLIGNEIGGIMGLIVAIASGAVVYAICLRLVRAVPRADFAMIEPIMDRLPRRMSRQAKRVFALVTT